MNVSRILTIIAVFVSLTVVGGLYYFASQVSAVYPPLKKYEYANSMTKFTTDLTNLSKSNHRISYKVTDTTGSGKNGFDYYIKLNVRDSKTELEYNIAYKQERTWNGGYSAEIFLIGAFDRIRKTGGYKTENKDIDRLVRLFEQEVVNKLNTTNTSP